MTDDLRQRIAEAQQQRAEARAALGPAGERIADLAFDLATASRTVAPDEVYEAIAAHRTEVLADMVDLRQARVTLQMFRHAISGTATQITDLVRDIGRATGPLARAQREAAHYRRRWESTVVEARRQAARADDLEQEAERAAWNTMRLGEVRNRLRTENAQLRAELDRTRAELATAKACACYPDPLDHEDDCPTRAAAPTAT